MADARAAEKKGDFETAYKLYIMAASYGVPGAQDKVNEIRKRLVDSYYQIALKALHQTPTNDPAKCLALLDRALQYDPGNESVKSQRQRCSKANCTVNPGQCGK